VTFAILRISAKKRSVKNDVTLVCDANSYIHNAHFVMQKMFNLVTTIAYSLVAGVLLIGLSPSLKLWTLVQKL